MPVSNIPIIEIYTCNTEILRYDFGFRIFEAENIKVSVEKKDGAITDLQQDIDYTVESFNQEGTFEEGGYILLLKPYDNEYTIIIERYIEPDQQMDLDYAAPLPSQAITYAFDKLTMLSQQIKNGVARSIQISVIDPGSFNLTVPPVTLRKNKFLGFDSAGNITVHGSTIHVDAELIDGVPVSTTAIVEKDILQYIGGKLVPRGIAASGTVKTFNNQAPDKKGNISVNSDAIPEGTHNEYFTDANLAKSGSFVALKAEADKNDEDIGVLVTEYHALDEKTGTNTTNIETNAGHITDNETEIARKISGKTPMTANHIPKWDTANLTLTDGYDVGSDINDLVQVGISGHLPTKVIPAIPINDSKVFRFDFGTDDNAVWTYIVEHWEDEGDAPPEPGSIAFVLMAESLGATKYLMSEIWAFGGQGDWKIKTNWAERVIEDNIVYSWIGHTHIIDQTIVNNEVDKLACIVAIKTQLQTDTAQIATNKGGIAANKNNTAGNLVKINTNGADITKVEEKTSGMLNGTEKFSSIDINGKVIDGVSDDPTTNDKETLVSSFATHIIYQQAQANKTEIAAHTTQIV